MAARSIATRTSLSGTSAEATSISKGREAWSSECPAIGAVRSLDCFNVRGHSAKVIRQGDRRQNPAETAPNVTHVHGPGTRTCGDSLLARHTALNVVPNPSILIPARGRFVDAETDAAAWAALVDDRVCPPGAKLANGLLPKIAAAPDSPFRGGAAPPVILYLLGDLNHGGGEMRSLELFEEIKARQPKVDIVLYTISKEAGKLEERFRRTGARIVRRGKGFRGFLDFWRACRRHRAAVLHANAGTFGGYFALVAFAAGVRKRICHFRTTSEERTGIANRVKAAFGLVLLHLFGTEFVGVCAAARHYPRISERRWTTIYNGIRCDEPATALRKRRAVERDGSRNLVVLGRISPEKNFIRPVRIFEALAESRRNELMTLHFVGTGSEPNLALLQRRIAASPASRSIILHGVSDEPLADLRRADLLLLTSLREGLPGVILEALSVGTPVVASDLPGVREIGEAVEGVTRVPASAPDHAWCDAILAVLSDNRAEAIIHSFARGPFKMGAHMTQMAALWDLPRFDAA
jgi:glycosyltransferase involved in cell wall biosynthesis